MYGTPEIPPLVETFDDLLRELDTAITVGAFRDGRLVGAARLTIEPPIGWISRVAVAPDQQGQGIGGRLLAAIESVAPPEVDRFQLAAGGRSEDNIAMYARRGYQEMSRRHDAAGVELVIMGKPRS
jgi:GNAT superfamily N-acetyltransferase